MKYIFLHGLGQSSSSWDKTIEALNCKTDVLCPNLADWLINQVSSYQTLYQELEQYCHQFDEPICLCGLSLGGVLALEYATKHMDKVHSLVLIGAQYRMPKHLLKIQNLFFRLMPNSMFSQMGFQKSDFISLCQSMIAIDLTDDLNKIKCPTLVLCGKKDKANQAASIQLAKLIPNAKFKMILDAGHEINVDQPIVLGKEINPFFESN